jgi:nitroimidazol reductase NimA-like FMN-containing flavoprotein (pyridoxamine 5'-phosphate oxidase superfamily)
MPVLSRTERDEFLREPGVLMRVAVVRDDGAPLVTPIWFIFEHARAEDTRGSEFIYFTPREKSEWFACLRRDPRVSLCIDEQPLPYRKVLADGVAELVFDVGKDAEWRDLYLRIAERYVGPEGARTYIENTIEEPRGLYRLDLQQARIKTWRMPIEGEAPEGIWHQRYYLGASGSTS